MNGRKLILACFVALSLALTLFALSSPSLGTQVNVLPLTLTNERATFDLPGLSIHSSVTGTVTSTVEMTGSVKVATAIANFYGVSVDSVTAMHDAGHGYGEIVKAFALAKLLGDKTADDIFKLRAENQGWGQLLKSLAVSKWDTSVGKLMRVKQEAVTGQAPGNSGDHRQDQNKEKCNNGKCNDNDDDKNDDKGNKGQGNGKGNGKGNSGK